MHPVFQLSYNSPIPLTPLKVHNLKYLCVGASHHHCFNTSQWAIGCWCFLNECLFSVILTFPVLSFAIVAVVHPSSSCITAALTSYYILIYHVKIQWRALWHFPAPLVFIQMFVTSLHISKKNISHQPPAHPYFFIYLFACHPVLVHSPHRGTFDNRPQSASHKQPKSEWVA